MKRSSGSAEAPSDLKPAARIAWWTLLTVEVAILLAPLAIVDVPPVLDYPNHLAREVLLAAGPDDPVLGPIFTPNWSILPNLAGDIVGVALLRLLPVHVAGRGLLAIALLLNLAGVLALHRALFGRRSFWPLGAGLVAYNVGFLYGFINFLLGTGLAMLFAAAWLLWRDRLPVSTIIAGAVAAVGLFFCHLMGLAFFLLLIGSAEFRSIRDLRSAATRLGGLVVTLIGPIVLSMLTVLRDAPAATHWVSPRVKLENAATGVINYLAPLDIVSAVLIGGGILLGLAGGFLVAAPRGRLALMVLPAAYLMLPFDLMSAAFLDVRASIMLAYVLFAGMDLAPTAVRLGRPIAAGVAVLFVTRMAVVAAVWAGHRHDLAELRAAIDPVPPGAAVFVTNVPPEEAPAYWAAGPLSRHFSNTLRAEYHMPALLLIERGAFWQDLFANPAQQPIRLRPRFAALAREAHTVPPHARLIADPSTAFPALAGFDFVLMLEAGADPNLKRFLPDCLALETRSDFAALFRVVAACRSAAPAFDRPGIGRGP